MAENGRKSVIASAVSAGAAELEAAAPQQMPLFEAPTRFTGEDEAKQRAALDRAHRGAGRPPGAQNKATKAIREYLLTRGVDPLVQLARWAMHTPETLALELGCDKLEAFKELRATWGDLAPYLYGKAAPTDDDGNVVPTLQMFVGGAPIAGPGARAPWEYLEMQGEQNQPLSGAAADVSHADVSHGRAK